jgi:hypothetical protein
MKAIKIVAVPTGDAPKWVRREWLNIVLPLAEIDGEEKSALYFRGASGSPPDKENKIGWIVDARVAFAILRSKNSKAALWWETHTNQNRAKYLKFGKKFCTMLRSSIKK